MIFELFGEMVSYLLFFVKQFGYFGIFAGMAVESSFIPFPSEIIIIPAGALIAKGEMNFFMVFFAGLLGSVLGAAVNYLLALFLGRTVVDVLVARYGKFLFISGRQLEKTDDYFKKYGDITTFVGRLIPGVRQIISLPAGFGRMNFFKFLWFTSLGAGIWILILMGTGYFFQNNYESMLNNIKIILILISLIIIFGYLIYRKKKSKRS